jgi:uncharacterized protein YndB with AHSA1/START domain
MILTELGKIRIDGPTVAIIFTREYAATPDEIWAALTEPERLSRWFARPIGTLGAGHDVRLQFGDGADEYADLHLRRCEPPHRVEGEWAFPGGPTTTLRLTVAEQPDSVTRVTLEHTGFPPDGTAGTACGWHHKVDALDAYLRGAEQPSFADYYPAMLDRYREAVANVSSVAP